MRLLKSLLTLNPKEGTFAARGFDAGDPASTRKLEGMIQSFIAGFNTALTEPDLVSAGAKLNREFDSHHVGFAFEGFGLYLAGLDLGLPGKSTRLAEFVTGMGVEHDYIVAVGAGFAIPRVPWGRISMSSYLKTLDPLLSWCVPCGYGFHEAFFRHQRYIDRAATAPSALCARSKRLFDSGMGRAMWWVKCADPKRIADTIDRFPEDRRAELWAGIGIACCYASIADSNVIHRLDILAGDYRMDFLSGLPFAARLRQKAGNYSEPTEMVCRLLLDLGTDETADMAEASADAVRHRVSTNGITDAYDLVRGHLVGELKKSHRVQVR